MNRILINLLLATVLTVSAQAQLKNGILMNGTYRSYTNVISGGGGGGSITFVQRAADNDEVAHAFATTNNVTSGNVLAIGCIWGPNTVSLTSITTTRSGSATLLDNPTAETGNAARTAMGVVNLTSGGTCTITFNFSGGLSYFGGMVHEYSGVDTANMIDNGGLAHKMTDSQNLGTGTDAYTSGAFTTTSANCMIVGFAFDVNENNNLSIGTGYTGRYVGQAGHKGVSEDKVLAVAGSTAATFTCSSAFLSSVVGGLALKPQ